MRVKHLLFLAVFSVLAACSTKQIDENLTERELYEQAQQDLDDKNYASAIRKLRAMESRYPFGRYAEQAQLELIYASYQYRDYEALEAAADRFIRLHPQHPNVDYAYYMKGLSAFDQGRGFLARWLPLDMTQRDPGATRDAYNEFSRLISRFPNSQYASDARQRMIYARNLLADYEVHAARYYIKRKAHLAALNRGRYVVENFQETAAVPDGLAIMAQSYQVLGMDELAQNSLNVLKLNYPDHPSLASGEFIPQYREPASRTWLNKASFGLLGEDSSSAAQPPQASQASKEMERQYKDALESIPKEVKTIQK